MVAHRLAVEGDRSGQAGPLGQDLDVGPGVADGRHDHLDQAGPLAGRSG